MAHIHGPPNTKLDNTVFMLTDAARILGMPKSRVKNWTIGRPLRIDPSVHAHGTGSRNIYTRRELYRLAIANQLHRDGLNAETIQSVLDAFDPTFTRSIAAAIRRNARGEVTVDLIGWDSDGQENCERLRNLICSAKSCHVLQISLVTQGIDEEIRRFVHERA
jgi:hypothetical protein